MEIKIWLGNLGEYNSGRLIGEWLTLPMDSEELAACVAKYSRNGSGDYFIADHEEPIKGLVSESSSPIALNEIAESLASLSEENDLPRVEFLISEGYSIPEALDKYEDVTFYQGCRLDDVAEQLVDDGCFGDIPEGIANYIDYEAIGRDLGFDGYTETPAGVFVNN